MKNFKTPEWDNNKVGDNAHSDFANVNANAAKTKATKRKHQNKVANSVATVANSPKAKAIRKKKDLIQTGAKMSSPPQVKVKPLSPKGNVASKNMRTSRKKKDLIGAQITSPIKLGKVKKVKASSPKRSVAKLVPQLEKTLAKTLKVNVVRLPEGKLQQTALKKQQPGSVAKSSPKSLKKKAAIEATQGSPKTPIKRQQIEAVVKSAAKTLWAGRSVAKSPTPTKRVFSPSPKKLTFDSPKSKKDDKPPPRNRKNKPQSATSPKSAKSAKSAKITNGAVPKTSTEKVGTPVAKPKSPQKLTKKPKTESKTVKKQHAKSPEKQIKKSPEKQTKKSPEKQLKKSPEKQLKKSPEKQTKKSPEKQIKKSLEKQPKSSPNKTKLPLNTASKAITKKKPKKVNKHKIKIAALLGNKVPLKKAIQAGNKSPQKSLAPSTIDRKTEKIRKKLSTMVATASASASTAKAPDTLRSRMLNKLKSARFRYINEELYTKDSNDAVRLFADDPKAFDAYHDGYRQQVQKWPMNPLTKIIASIQKMPQNLVVADFGCGDATLAKSVKQTVHSFDLVSHDPSVTVCDMSNVPLKANSVDVAVYCLSLMGTNLQDYIIEANRVLKVGGILKIAEVESRFDKVETFVAGVERFGFQNFYKDYNYNLFYFMDFRKVKAVKSKKNLPTMSLLPCIYKKR